MAMGPRESASAKAAAGTFRAGARRWLQTAAVAMAFLCAGSAWADSLALMSGAGQSGLGGSASAQPVVVQVRNVNGLVVAGRTINWTTSNGFVLSAASSVTDANGLASVSFTYGNYGTTNIVATDSVGATSASARETSLGSDSITLVSGGGQTGQAGTAGSQPIVVQVLNAAGNAVVGRTVNWSDTTAYTRVGAASSVTNTGGFATMTFSYVAGPPVFAGTPAGIMATNSIGGQSVTATVTEIGTNVLTIPSGLQITGLAGQTSAPIVGHVADWQGNPIAGATVTWSTPLTGIFNLSSTSTITDASGNASITAQYLGGTGDDIITANYNGFQVDVHFYVQTQTHMDLLSPNPIIGSPNTASATPMKIQDFNKDGTPRVGDTITWIVDSGDAVPNAATSVTDATGTATMGFTFGTLLTQFLPTDSRGVSKGALVNPSVSGQTVQLVSGAGQAGLSQSAAASPVVMRVVNQAGVPQPGVTVNWTQYANGTFGFQGNVVYTSPTTTVSDAAGLVQATFNFGAVGKVAIRAELLSTLGSAATVTSYGTETLTVLSGSAQSGLVGAHGAQPVVVVFRDPSGNPLANRTITWAVTNGGAVLDTTSSLTDASGQASVGFTYGPTATINRIEASATSGNAFVGPITANAFVTGVGANSITLISGNGQTGLVDSTGAQPLVVEVRDAAGNPAAGRTINWTNVAGLTSAIASSSVTDAAGRASMTFIYGSTPAIGTITAIDSVNGQRVVFTLTSTKAASTGSIVSGNGQSGLPGTAGPQPIVIQLRDANNAPVAGKTVTWTVVSGPATLGPVTTLTDASGQAAASFNFGATAGTSIIQAQGPDSGQLLQAAVTALGNNQALSLVSGDGQELVANTPSAPLVVLLKDFSNLPVAGATITWTTTVGTLAAATSVTDTAGKATNTVTVPVAGAVTVTANSTLAASAVTFTLSTGLVTLPNLTPEQQAVAGAVDELCPALASKPSLTPEEADLLARCREITAAAALNPGATATALGELLTDTAQAQSSAATAAVNAQFQNINTRLTTLRAGSPAVNLSGLSFTGSGGVIPLASLMTTLLGDAAGDAAPKPKSNFSRWGFFASGNIGRGESDANRSTPAYDYDIDGLTAGLDYRQRDNWIIGGALGYTRQDTNLSGNQGDVAMNGWSLSTYSTYSFKELWYVDGVVTFGRNQYKMNRRISYTLPTAGGGTTTINQVASGHPSGDLFSTALTFGGDFHVRALGISPYGQLLYSRTGFDSYEETLRAGPGSGLGLAVDSRSVTALSGILGSRFTYTHSTNWGVMVPTAALEWQHEFKDDLQSISARFIHDPTGTLITLSGEPTDSDYLRLSVGLSLVLTHGRSGFFLYQRVLARTGQSQDDLSIGFRIEF